MKLTNSFLASAHQISQISSSPNRVLEAMKRTMEKTMVLLQNRYVLDLLKNLQAKNIGTTEITSLCQRTCQRLPKQRARTLRKIVIKWKIQDASNCLRKARSENTKTWREVKPLLVSEKVHQIYEELWSREKSCEAKRLREKLKSKTRFLDSKYNQKEQIPDTIHGINIADQVIPPDFSSEPRVYGGASLTENEKEVLALPPNFALYEQVNPHECETQVEKALAKLRWAIKEQKNNEEGNEQTQRRKHFDQTTNTFNFRDMRGTDLPFNRRITLPPPVDIQMESKMRSLNIDLKEITKNYIQNTSNKINNNLSHNQVKGLKTLYNQISSGDIVVFQTDKSGRFAVDTTENYRKAGSCHVEGDTIITSKEHKEIEDLTNAHARCWVRMLGAGTQQKDQKRIKDSMLSADAPPAPLYVLRKDHKDPPINNTLETNQIIIGPPTRPVCGANQAANRRLSYLMNVITSEVWKNDIDTVCLSTEEMVAEIDRVNTRHHGGGLVIGSTDVKALYPSLDIDFTVEKVCDVIRQSNIKFEGLWYEELGLYIAIHTTHTELDSLGLAQVCPKRTTNRGRKPTVKSLNPEESSSSSARHTHWSSPEQAPNNHQKREMVIKALHIALTFIMRNHTYTFGNQIRKQSNGGPIGLDITGAIAQIFMMWWCKEFKTRLSILLIALEMMKCYVDDVNWALPPIKPGMRYQDGAIHQREDLVNHDTGIMEDLRTMLLLKDIGNDIHPSIQIEVDCPSKHADNRMPILDLKVWVDKTEERSKIMHEHYSKDVSSKMVISAKSALSMNTKRTVLTQEALRVLLNCSRDLPWENKLKHLDQLSLRMQFSGYTKEFRFHVMSSAVKAHNTLIQKELNGDRPLYRSREWNKFERRQQKEQKKKDWYKEGDYDSVMFIPATPGSALKRCYDQIIRGEGLKIRVVEKAGMSLKRKLQRSNPFKPKICSRSNCFICTTGGDGPCDVAGVTYNILCKECVMVIAKYIGESSHTGYTRGAKHLDDLENKRVSCRAYEHVIEKHNGIVPEFQMNVTGVYRDDTMLRQISEAVRIRNSDPKNLLNNKSEWNIQNIPQVIITRS